MLKFLNFLNAEISQVVNILYVFGEQMMRHFAKDVSMGT